MEQCLIRKLFKMNELGAFDCKLDQVCSIETKLTFMQ